MQAQVAVLDEQIAALTQTAKLDVQASYRRRALETLARAEQLRGVRQEVSEALLLKETAPPTHAQAGMVAGLAVLFGIDAGRMLWLAYGVVALMLELISITAIVLLGWRSHAAHPCRSPSMAAMHFCSAPGECDSAKAPGANTPSSGTHQKSVGTQAGNNLPQEYETNSPPLHLECKKESGGSLGAKEPSEESERSADPKYDEAKQLVLSGAIVPRYRDLKGTLNIGQHTVQRYLGAMLDEGCVIRCGRRYVPSPASS
jgi:hypothetical protein